MIGVDTNILVYAHRRDSELHTPAAEKVKALGEGRGAWAIPWPCVHEFFAITTHPRIFDPPSTSDQAIAQLVAWLGSPSLTLLAESQNHWSTLRRLITAARISGPQVHDARVAALCLDHGVRELWSVDRDFGRFTSLTVVNPLVDL